MSTNESPRITISSRCSCGAEINFMAQRDAKEIASVRATIQEAERDHARSCGGTFARTAATDIEVAAFADAAIPWRAAMADINEQRADGVPRVSVGH